MKRLSIVEEGGVGDSSPARGGHVSVRLEDQIRDGSVIERRMSDVIRGRIRRAVYHGWEPFDIAMAYQHLDAAVASFDEGLDQFRDRVSDNDRRRFYATMAQSSELEEVFTLLVSAGQVTDTPFEVWTDDAVPLPTPTHAASSGRVEPGSVASTRGLVKSAVAYGMAASFDHYNSLTFLAQLWMVAQAASCQRFYRSFSWRLASLWAILTGLKLSGRRTGAAIAVFVLLLLGVLGTLAPMRAALAALTTPLGVFVAASYPERTPPEVVAVASPSQPVPRLGFDVMISSVGVRPAERITRESLSRMQALATAVQRGTPLGGDAQAGAQSLAFSGDGRGLTIASPRGPSLHSWRIFDESVIQSRTLEGTTEPTSMVELAADSQKLVAVAEGRSVILWSSTTWQPVELWSSQARQPRQVLGLNLSPDGALLALGFDDDVIKILRTDDGTVVHTFKHQGSVQSVVFSPDGQLLATGSNQGTVKLWQVRDEKLRYTLRGHRGDIRDLSFSRDGLVLASASNDDTVRLWDVASGEMIKTLDGGSGRIKRIEFSPDGTLLASATSDDAVQLWSLPEGQLARQLPAPAERVADLSFEDEGRLFASVSVSGTVCVWGIPSSTGVPSPTRTQPPDGR